MYGGKELDLSHTCITTAGLARFMDDSIGHNNCIVKLNLSHTLVQVAQNVGTDVRKILDAMSHNCSLGELKLEGCLIDPEFTEELG